MTGLLMLNGQPGYPVIVQAFLRSEAQTWQKRPEILILLPYAVFMLQTR